VPDADPPFTPTASPRWSVERRLDFIASRLAWEGRINRLDLVARFGVSPNQATADLKRFEALHPGALRYDTRAKTYRAGPGAAPPDASAAALLLRELRLIAEGVLGTEDGALAVPPPAELAEPPLRPVAPGTLSVVLAAIRESRALHGLYQSFSAPEPRRRTLEPHALVFDGFRWHARARDVEADRFRDFVLGRLSDARLGDVAKLSPDGDHDWTARVEIEIAPHPDLAPHQRTAIAVDYGMIGERLTLTPRLAVCDYVKRRLGLTEGHQTRPARDQHIVLVSERTLPPPR
jgi:predicted DNA-binding transcriptional regulator YafY